MCVQAAQENEQEAERTKALLRHMQLAVASAATKSTPTHRSRHADPGHPGTWGVKNNPGIIYLAAILFSSCCLGFESSSHSGAS